MDYVLAYMKNHVPMTVNEYCALNYSMTWEELQRSDNVEWRAEVEDLVEQGFLQVEVPGSKLIQ